MINTVNAVPETVAPSSLGMSERSFTAGEWRVDPLANEIERHGVVARIEPKMMLLLVSLAQSARRPVSRSALNRAIWHDVVVGDDALSRLVCQLRRVLGDTIRAPRYIETIPRVGYRLAVSATPVCHRHREARNRFEDRLPRSVEPSPMAVRTARARPLGAMVERLEHPSALVAVAMLGAAFSGGWWSVRQLGRRVFDR